MPCRAVFMPQNAISETLPVSRRKLEEAANSPNRLLMHCWSLTGYPQGSFGDSVRRASAMTPGTKQLRCSIFQMGRPLASSEITR